MISGLTYDTIKNMIGIDADAFDEYIEYSGIDSTSDQEGDNAIFQRVCDHQVNAEVKKCLSSQVAVGT